MEKFDITKAKNGDILVEGTNGYKNEPWLGKIFIFKGIEDNCIKFHCYYDIVRRSFHICENEKVHLGVVNDYTDVRPATTDEQLLLWEVIDDYKYYWDDELNKLVLEDKREIGKPEVTNIDLFNGSLHITHLNGIQRSIIEDLIKSWNK